MMTDPTLTEEQMVDVLNIFLIYFKNLFSADNTLAPPNKTYTMFTGINQTNDDQPNDKDNQSELSTSRCMEFIYNEIYKTKTSTNPDIHTIFHMSDITKDTTCDELYVLEINNTPTKAAFSLFTLIKYIAINQEPNWAIIPIKTT